MSDLILRKLSKRLIDAPGFLAGPMAHYASRSGSTLADLAPELNTNADQVYRLALCRVPRADHFNQDVRVIASCLDLSPDALTAFIRRL